MTVFEEKGGFYECNCCGALFNKSNGGVSIGVDRTSCGHVNALTVSELSPQSMRHMCNRCYGGFV